MIVDIQPPGAKSRVGRHLSAHLPLLRRFAHAYTGGPQAGDARVARFLEAGRLPPPNLGAQDLRNSLVAAFLAYDRSAENDDKLEPGLSCEDLRAALLRVQPPERAAVLLHDMCDVAYADLSVMVGLTPMRTAHLVRAGRAALLRQCGIRVMVIEDEPLIALDIERTLSDMGHIVCATVDRRSDAAALAERTRPALILADLNLGAGGSGADAVADILARIDACVMFVTAHPERVNALGSFDEATVLAKPFDSAGLRFAVDRALARRSMR